MTSGIGEEQMTHPLLQGPLGEELAVRLASAYEKAHRVNAPTTIGEDIQSATQLRMAIGTALALLRQQGLGEEVAKAAVRDVMRTRLRSTAKALHRKYLRLQGTVRDELPAQRQRQPLANTSAQGPATVLESIRRTVRASGEEEPGAEATRAPAPIVPVSEVTARKVANEKLLLLKSRRRREYIFQTCLLLETQSFLRPSSQDVRERATATRRLAQFLESLTLQLDPICHSITAANRGRELPSNFRLFVDSLRLTYGDLPALRALSEDFELDLNTEPTTALPQTAGLQAGLRKVRRSSSFTEASPRKRSREEFDRDAAPVAAPPTKAAARSTGSQSPAWKSNSTGTFITRSNSAPSGSALARRLRGGGFRSSGVVLHTVTVTSRRPGAGAVRGRGAANTRKQRRM